MGATPGVSYWDAGLYEASKAFGILSPVTDDEIDTVLEFAEMIKTANEAGMCYREWVDKQLVELLGGR